VGKAGAIAVVVAFAVAGAGCGKADGGGQVSVGGPKTPAAKIVAAAAAATEQLDTGTFEETFTEKTDHDASQNLSTTSTGSFDRPAKQSESTTTGSVPDASDGSGSGSFVGPSEEIRDGDTLYMKFPPGSAFPGAGDAAKPWVRETLRPQVPTSSLFFFGSFGPLGTDPLAQLERVSSDVSDLGPAPVDGINATHYQATITPQDELRMRTGTTAPEGGPWDTDPTATDPRYMPTIHIGIWIDAGGLIRRLTIDEDGVIGITSSGESSTDGSPGTSQVTAETGSISMTYDLLTVNQPVHIVIPPADQVTDMGGDCGSTSSSSTTSTMHPGNSTGLECVSTGMGTSISGGSGVATTTSMSTSSTGN
jgi:hypothetical protein